MTPSASCPTNVQQIVRTAKQRFVLNPRGLHGVAHWERVRANGLRVADRLLVELFAFLHDCCREDDGNDYGHGQRAADFAASLRGSLLHLSAADFALLHEAIRDHERGRTRADVTVMTCWDADRLDLGRVGRVPDPRYLCTEHARAQETIAWAYRRSLRP